MVGRNELGASFLRKLGDDARASARYCFTTHKPTLALTLSERASSYYDDARANARIVLQRTISHARFNALGEG